MRSSARGIESDARSSSIWRASSARLSSRSVRTRSRHSPAACPSARPSDPPTSASSVGEDHLAHAEAVRHVRDAARRGRARAGRRHAPARPGSSSTRRPPRTRKRAASSAACGSRPSSTTWRTSWKWACACMLPPMTPKGPGRRPSRSSSPGMIVWNGRRPGAIRLGWPSSSVKPAPRLCSAIPVSPTVHARAEARRRSTGSTTPRCARRRPRTGRSCRRPATRACRPRPAARSAPAARRRRAASTGRVADRARGPVQRELGRLDVAVQVAVEPLGDAEGHERGGALGVGRQLADLDAAIRAAQRRDPFGAVRGEVVLGEPARRGDGGGDRTLVDRVGPAIGDRLQGAPRGRAGGSARRGAAPATAPAPAPRASARRSAPWPRRRCAPHRSRRRAPRRARGGRSARPASAHARTAPGTVTERGPAESTVGASMCAGARPEPLRPYSSPSNHSCAKASPPTPLCGGSHTVSMAAAASAASTALPPASSARTPARVASGWLVATIASAAIVGRRAPARGARGGERTAVRSASKRRR